MNGSLHWTPFCFLQENKSLWAKFPVTLFSPKMEMQHTSKTITKLLLTTASGQYIFPQALTTLVENSTFFELRNDSSQIKGWSKSLKTDCSVLCLRSLGGMQNGHKKELQHYMKRKWIRLMCVFLWSTVGLHT